MSRRKKVFVTGCFDLLHSGHITFLNEAAKHGDVYVGIGSDKTIFNLKGRYPVNNQDERKFMLEALRSVKRCSINEGSGIMDFSNNPDALDADILFVNEDGNSPEKEKFCRDHGIIYIVSKRIPHGTLPVRSTTALRIECNIPYRIDLAGGWLDQPYVSKFHPGAVITISIEPTIEFNDRSGMASSTRRKAIELWQFDIPGGDKEKLAKMLFCYENPPGTSEVSGSQDAIGIVFPGVNRLYYNNNYWPEKIDSVTNESVLSFIENHLQLITLEPRTREFSVLDGATPNKEGAKRLAEAADGCWDAIIKKDLEQFGKYFKDSFEAQVSMFPKMIDNKIKSVINHYENIACGWKLTGAGGGGYLILVSDQPIPNTLKIKIRRGE